MLRQGLPRRVPRKSDTLNNWRNRHACAAPRAAPTRTTSEPHPNQLESPPRVRCAKGCPDAWVGDGMCDHKCDSAACAFDGGDCDAGEVRTDVCRVGQEWLPPLLEE